MGLDGKPVPGPAGKGVYVDPVAFFNRPDVMKEFPLIPEIALFFLSVPLSTASVERTFSLLTRMEDPTRLRMKDASVVDEHFLQCHRDLIESKMHAALQACIDSRKGTAAAAGGAGTKAAEEVAIVESDEEEDAVDFLVDDEIAMFIGSDSDSDIEVASESESDSE